METVTKFSFAFTLLRLIDNRDMILSNGYVHDLVI